MKITTLEDLLFDELNAIYSAENQVINILPRMAKTAGSDDLQTLLEDHLEQTHTHVQRLEQICEALNVKPRGKKCLGMEGIIEEGREMLENETEREPLEAALIGIAQRVEHYEIAAYGTARAHARQLGFMKAVEVLGETLEEEKQADRQFTKLAQNQVNVQAAMSKVGV